LRGLPRPAGLLAGFEEALLEGDGDVLGKADADEAAGGDGVAVRIRRRLRGR
jgi:hypothetical protein